jgi:hypothetical protein
LQTEPNLPKRGYEPCSFAPDVADALVRHGGIDNRIADRAMAHESLTRPPLIWEFPPRVSTSADWYESLPAAIGGRMMFACLIFEPRFVCTACGKRGADVRPDFDWGKPGALTKGS